MASRDTLLERARYLAKVKRDLPFRGFAKWCRANGVDENWGRKLARIGEAGSPEAALRKLRDGTAGRNKTYRVGVRKMVSLGRKVSRDAKA